MERMKRHGWNLQTMNEYCKNQNNGYLVLDIKWIEKPYQKQLWAFVKCSNKNHKPYWVWWNNFLHEFLCKKCDYENKNKNIWTKEQVIDFYKQYGLEVLDIDCWRTVDKGIICKDKIGFKYNASITTLKQGGYCFYLFNKLNPYSLENIKLYCSLFRNDYEIISDKYIGIKEDYIWKYNGDLLPKTENKEFIITADNFINGGCGHPYFSKSNGNKIFESELIKNSIAYKREKTFKGCRDKKLLRFDFYLLKSREIVEIDGLQHEMVIGIFGGEEGLVDRRRKDSIKNEYCKNNGIKVTRIPYQTNKVEIFKKLVDEKINEILNSKLY